MQIKIENHNKKQLEEKIGNRNIKKKRVGTRTKHDVTTSAKMKISNTRSFIPTEEAVTIASAETKVSDKTSIKV